ncbi:DUF998 domain-containing protein [Methanocella sp. MCL-LM]|uniref:DUF998 domain-containing protein n=1 Tax=Methanocella sp. MCL-LM TaxID=3412035 RepID=UPI003C792BA2
MNVNKYLRSISILSAAVAIVTFCTLLLLAIMAYPGPFSPFTNYLSDLGSSKLNPSGAILFNAACWIAGAMTILFFAGLGSWRTDGRVKLTIARLLGAFSGLALILVGVFPEDYGRLHTIVAGAFFISLTLAIVATGFALWKGRDFLRPIGYYGILVGIFSLIYLASYLAGYPILITEWITVMGAMGWMGLVAYNMARLPKAGEGTGALIT